MRPPEDAQVYEATYLGWIDFFEALANSPEPVRVVGAPRAWIHFIEYMGHEMSFSIVRTFEDTIVLPPAQSDSERRRLVEISSSFRPELVHALYLWDTDWLYRPAAEKRYRLAGVTHPCFAQYDAEFVVTGNAGFFHPLVVQYLARLHDWDPSVVDATVPCIICPCAADKPYPAPLHQAIREAVPNSYLIVATGVLGMVPEDLWLDAPNYDAGLPNFVRVYEETKKLFQRMPRFAKLVMYSDYNAFWIAKALDEVGVPYVSVFDTAEQIEGYYNLMDPKNLERLSKLCQL